VKYNKILGVAMAALLSLSLAACTSDNKPEGDDLPTVGFSGTCNYEATGSAAKTVDLPPTSEISNEGTVDFTLTLTEGDLTGPVRVTMDRSNAPCAVNSFESLVKQDYYTGTTCHRLVPGFVLQCGDPSGIGNGGPGYRYDDELTGNEKYTTGTVAMANAGPNTNGSQFFFMLADNPSMAASYTVLGHVSDDASLAILKQIEAAGLDPNDSKGIAPILPVSIDSIVQGSVTQG
jgi:peptidyl-prolyl cis-trans isomerase B (cyclophilin B)